MAVPEEIRKVPRPVNTIVVDSGRPGPLRYAVRARAGVKYVPGGNPQPRNGKVIGHIFEGKFVPAVPRLASRDTAPGLAYGISALIKAVTSDVLTDLLQVYPKKDARMLMAMVTLRVPEPVIAAENLENNYRISFVSRYYPGLEFSPQIVSTFLEKLGRNAEKRRAFFKLRVRAVAPEHHLAISTLTGQAYGRADESAASSRKAGSRGSKTGLFMYAYDLEDREPVCAEVFPSRVKGANPCAEFIRDCDIQKAVIAARTGFSPDRTGEELENRPDLHFLVPIKRTDARIRDYGLLEYEGAFAGEDGTPFLYKKAEIQKGRYLYAFMNADKMYAEGLAFVAKVKREGRMDMDAYTRARELFGVRVLESDLDLPPRTVCAMDGGSGLPRQVFRNFRNTAWLDKSRKNGDFAAAGLCFVNFISALAVSRILRKAGEAQLLDRRSYNDLMYDLSYAWREADAPDELPYSTDCFWMHTPGDVLEVLEALGLSRPGSKRGRPRKIKSAGT